MKIYAIYRYDFRPIEVEVMDTDIQSATIRALNGTPFTIRGSKPPYLMCRGDVISVPLAELENVRVEGWNEQAEEHELKRIDDWLETWLGEISSNYEDEGLSCRSGC